MGLLEGPVIVAFFLTTVLELALGGPPRKIRKGGPRRPRPILALGMVLSLILFILFPYREGAKSPEMLAVVAGALVLFAGALPSDLTVSKSRRHFYATLLATVPLVLTGIWVDHLGVPGLGKINIIPAVGIVFTFIWVFGIVGIIEVCSLLPYLTSVVGLLVCSALFLPVEINRSPTGIVVAGVLMGALLGRFAGQFLHGQGRSPEKTETLLLGYFLSFLTLSLFLKAVTLAGLILPLTFIIVLISVVAMQSFERSLILRPWPRE